MIEDDLTVQGIRKVRRRKRSFMSASELRLLRNTVIKVTQAELGAELINPDEGLPVRQSQVCAWESGRRVPLWAARRVRELAEAARKYDFKREG
jgi:DNA-binding transcriptional regulator YiaG